MGELESLVIEKYQFAKENKHLFFFESTKFDKENNDILFHISYVPSLAKKPGVENKKINNDNEENLSPSLQKEVNPFLNPNPNLIVKEYDDYRILLNKFCVVPHHLLIVTKEYQKQTLPLFPPDMLIAWKTLKSAFGSTPGLVFYNCGTNSGASQPHKHMQIIPLPGINAKVPIQAIVDKIENSKAGEIYTLDQLPFVHVLTPLDRKFIEENSNDEAIIEDYLGQMFFGLLDGMFQQIRLNIDDDSAINVRSNLSYNFIMTCDFMFLVPRRSETATFQVGDLPYTLSFNSLVFAGFMLAKTELEKDALYYYSDLMDLLKQVGFERSIPAINVDGEQTSVDKIDEIAN
ncbi:unnamed protein product [Cunninghamella echinulata]